MFWIDERLTHQAGTDPFCVIVPGVGKIAQGGPGVFSLTNVSISPRHGLDGCGHGGWFLLLVLVCPGHDFKHTERHADFLFRFSTCCCSKRAETNIRYPMPASLARMMAWARSAT